MPGTLPVSGGTSEGNIFPAIKEFTAGWTGEEHTQGETNKQPGNFGSLMVLMEVKCRG